MGREENQMKDYHTKFLYMLSPNKRKGILRVTKTYAQLQIKDMITNKTTYKLFKQRHVWVYDNADSYIIRKRITLIVSQIPFTKDEEEWMKNQQTYTSKTFTFSSDFRRWLMF